MPQRLKDTKLHKYFLRFVWFYFVNSLSLRVFVARIGFTKICYEYKWSSALKFCNNMRT